MKPLRYFVSPMWVLCNVVLSILFSIALVAIWIEFGFSKVTIIMCAFIIFCGIIALVYGFVHLKSLMTTVICEHGIISKLLFFECKHLSWNSVKYFYVTPSYNFSADTHSLYIVLSDQSINIKRNMALTFNPRREIVIRLTPHNFAKVMSYMSRILPDNLTDITYIELQQLAPKLFIV